MPLLDNPNHERLANNLAKVYTGEIKTKTDAYKLTYPNSSHTNARTRAWELTSTRQDIKARVAELLAVNKLTKLESVVNNVGELTQANKVLPTKLGLIDTPDNSTRMEANKTLLKLHGALDSVQSTQDNRSVTINVTPQDLPQIQQIADVLTRMDRVLGEDGDVQDGEVV